jgi:cyclase
MAALERAGARTSLTTDPAVVRAAAFAVLPGVGAFGAVADRLRAMGVDAALRERVGRGAPMLGTCLGMQLFFESSEEAPKARGIGAIPGAITAYGQGVRSPQFGWNRISSPMGGSGGAFAYFANSFKLDEAPSGWMAATATYGAPFVAAIERGAVLLCQFHPELSGAWGQSLLSLWLARGTVEETAAGSTAVGSIPARSSSILAASFGEPAGAVVHGRPGGIRSTIPRIIPCLDVAGGRVVKGIRFEDVRDSGDPAELAARYEAEGADEIVVLDITAGVEGRDTAVGTVRSVRSRIGVPLCVGGGIRRLQDAEHVLRAGADKVSLNSMAYRNPALLSEIAREFGRQCCVVAIDATRRHGGPQADGQAVVVLDAGRTVTDTPVDEWIRRAVDAGAGEILLTSRDRDGTRTGYDLELLESALAAAPGTPLIASGGAASPEQILDGLRGGADAALLAGALHDGSLTIGTIKNYLRQNGVEAR